MNTIRQAFWVPLLVMAMVSLGRMSLAAEKGEASAPPKKEATLAIHLVSKVKDDSHSKFLAPAIEKVEIFTEPVLSDRDFISFDFQEQEFTITGAAADRLSRAIRKGKSPNILKEGHYEFLPYQTLFVMKAEGTPLYVGVITSIISSSSFDGPAILAENHFLKLGVSKPETLRIEDGYPGSFGGKKDPRMDRRIETSVKKLFPKGR